MISQERAVNAEKVIRKVVKRPVGDDTDVLFAAESILAQKLHGTASENLDWFLLSILNSSVVRWQIQHLAPRYARSYVLIEPKTLRDVFVPDPTRVPAKLHAEIVNESKRLWQSPDLDAKEWDDLDAIVLEAYNMPAELSEMIRRLS